MKTNLFLICLFLLFSSSCHNVDDTRKIMQYQITIDSLKKANDGMQYQIQKLSNKIREEQAEKAEQAQKAEKAEQTRRKAHSPNGNINQAINAVKFDLKMYHPNLTYDNIRTVSKTDGTVDVLLDITNLGVFKNERDMKGYNVSTYDNGTYNINYDFGRDIIGY